MGKTDGILHFLGARKEFSMRTHAFIFFVFIRSFVGIMKMSARNQSNGVNTQFVVIEIIHENARIFSLYA